MLEKIKIAAAAGSADALLARPDSGGDAPGVLFFMDAIGLRPQLESMVDRIASWGYVVLAPNLFYRAGTPEELGPKEDLRLPGARERFFGTVGPLMQGLTPDLAVADIDAYVRALSEIDGVTGPLATVGYCMGAGLAIRAAGAHQEFAAAAGFHGGNIATEAPISPHLAIGSDCKAEFLFGHAKDDPTNSADAIARLEAHLSAAGIDYTSDVYDGPHGYSMADTTMYDEGAAERSFAELESLLQRASGRR